MSTPRLFLFAIGARDRASSRLRVWDHLDWLRGQGFAVHADSQIEAGVTGAGPRTWLRALVRLPRWLAEAFRADAVFIQESLALWPFALLRNVGHRRRVVFDFSDPIDSVGSGVKAWLRRRLFALMVRRADVVMVENRAYHARLAGAPGVLSHFYGPVDAGSYGAARDRAARGPDDDRPLRFVWTGSPGTFAFVEPLLAQIDTFAASRPVVVSLIGAPHGVPALANARLECHPWREDTEFDLVAAGDFGLFRLPPGEAGLLRGAGKLFIYLAAGVIPIASARGISADLMGESGLGIPVADDDAWGAAIGRAMAMTSAEREDASRRARAHAGAALSYEAYRNQLVSLLAPSCEGVD